MALIPSTIFIAGAPMIEALRVNWQRKGKELIAQQQQLLFFTAPYNCTIPAFELCVVFDDFKELGGTIFIKLIDGGMKKFKTGDTLTVHGPLVIRLRGRRFGVRQATSPWANLG